MISCLTRSSAANQLPNAQDLARKRGNWLSDRELAVNRGKLVDTRAKLGVKCPFSAADSCVNSRFLHKNHKGLYEAKPQVLVQIKAQARYGKTAWKVG
ncbi:hypothetical protein AZ46_0219145 [Metabacillus indicus LMG 22858]|nr:hypothetical protein AZ46_0219145 [Metabacillus indicus LMG 22858]